MLIEGMHVYKEGDPVEAIYFLENGAAAYVLTRYDNFPYIEIEKGDQFGIIDIVFRNLQHTAIKTEDGF